MNRYTVSIIIAFALYFAINLTAPAPNTTVAQETPTPTPTLWPICYIDPWNSDVPACYTDIYIPIVVNP